MRAFLSALPPLLLSCVRCFFFAPGSVRMEGFPTILSTVVYAILPKRILTHIGGILINLWQMARRIGYWSAYSYLVIRHVRLIKSKRRVQYAIQLVLFLLYFLEFCIIHRTMMFFWGVWWYCIGKGTQIVSGVVLKECMLFNMLASAKWIKNQDERQNNMNGIHPTHQLWVTLLIPRGREVPRRIFFIGTDAKSAGKALTFLTHYAVCISLYSVHVTRSKHIILRIISILRWN